MDDDNIPTVIARYEIQWCPDPLCGPHIVFFDEDDKELCHLVVSAAEWWNNFKGRVESALYISATERDGIKGG